MKQKEVEKKFQEFFSFNALGKPNESNQQKGLIPNLKLKPTMEQKFSPQITQEAKIKSVLNTQKEKNLTPQRKPLESKNLIIFDLIMNPANYSINNFEENALCFMKDEGGNEYQESENSENVAIKGTVKGRQLSSNWIG